MDIITLFLLALGLSMDAFAVSITNGMVYSNYTKKDVILAALTFGLFQGIMPILGFYAGRQFSDLIQNLDHWIALILLGYIGGKMIWDAFHEEASCDGCKLFSKKDLLVQGLATSIDAMAVGISFALFDIQIYTSAMIITLVTIAMCLFGALLGKKVGEIIKSKSLFLGGVILVFIGLKIFIEHMF
ncbi:manganese efflux pump MntP [Anaerorhabdus sp.]|uniref:manganese efflux pump MntP n=1 Tax=Anaerorhabdus sp. TaxID=1872524 RepID=UPI002FCCB03E